MSSHKPKSPRHPAPSRGTPDWIINCTFGLVGGLLLIAGIVGIGLMVAGHLNGTPGLFRIGFWVALPAMAVYPLLIASIPLLHWIEKREERRDVERRQDK